MIYVAPVFERAQATTQHRVRGISLRFLALVLGVVGNFETECRISAKRPLCSGEERVHRIIVSAFDRDVTTEIRRCGDLEDCTLDIGAGGVAGVAKIEGSEGLIKMKRPRQDCSGSSIQNRCFVLAYLPSFFKCYSC